MSNQLFNGENIYKMTYQVHSYFPFQWELCLLVGYCRESDKLLQEIIRKLGIGEIF